MVARATVEHVRRFWLLVEGRVAGGKGDGSGREELPQAQCDLGARAHGMVGGNVAAWHGQYRTAGEGEELTSELPDRPAAPDSPTATHDAELWAFVQTLPRKQRAAIVLRYYEELSEAEIKAGIRARTLANQIVPIFGKRKPGVPERDDWRALLGTVEVLA